MMNWTLVYSRRQLGMKGPWIPRSKKGVEL